MLVIVVALLAVVGFAGYRTAHNQAQAQEQARSMAARVEAAIQKTEAFFESLGVPTRLSKYEGIAADTPQVVAAKLESRGSTKLGERQDIEPSVVAAILSRSLAA